MNTALHERRASRATLAQRVLASAPDAATSLDWDALDAAPPWLSLPVPALTALQRRLGAWMCAPVVRLWIDRPRLAAAAEGVGAAFLNAALAQAEAPRLPPLVTARLTLATAEQVPALLEAVGGAVLLATLSRGPWQRVAANVLAPVSNVDIDRDAARALLARVQSVAGEEYAS